MNYSDMNSFRLAYSPEGSGCYDMIRYDRIRGA